MINAKTKLQPGKDYPEWYEDRSLVTVSNGYLLQGETPKDAYWRVAKSVAHYLKKPELAPKFFNLMWKGWLGPASPVLANCGTDRGLPISCYSQFINDSINDIYNGLHEMAMLTKAGGGVGHYMGNIRPRGAPIKNNGISEGVVPWIKIYDSAIVATSQGGTRKGAAVFYLDVEHGDIEEFLRIRRPEGDINRQCLNIHHGVTISDDFMKKVLRGDSRERRIWTEILRTRFETGEPYIMWTDNVNKANPDCYKANNLKVNASNLCSEVMLHTDLHHSFVCCLSSMNLAKWEEWGHTDAIYLATWFLEGVLEEFIQKGRNIPGLERAIRSAIKGRAIGLGVMGWHSLLQADRTPYNSLRAKLLNKAIFGRMNDETLRASKDLAKEYGEPEWCRGFGIRHTHRIALAPTVSNSTICGGISPSIEPWVANTFNQKSAKGTFLVKNKELEKVLESHGQNTKAVWRSIDENAGSVQHLDFLSDDEKAVYLTAREINQAVLVDLAAERQEYIDQGQSLNLFYPIPTTDEQKTQLVKKIHDDHIMAWQRGVKTLYYMRTGSVLKVNFKDIVQEKDECLACEG